jgi:DNA-binding transcriptional LysR family regulator
MDIELARTFLAIVAAGSFVRAAELLNVSQTTVSARVRVLEEQLRRPPIDAAGNMRSTANKSGLPV